MQYLSANLSQLHWDAAPVILRLCMFCKRFEGSQHTMTHLNLCARLADPGMNAVRLHRQRPPSQKRR